MVFESDSVQNFISAEFRRRVEVNPRYSMRAYSRALGISSGALSEILNSRRPLSLKGAVRIAKVLGLNKAESKRFFELVEADRRRTLDKDLFTPPPKNQRQLDDDTFQLISEWQHFAILNLIDCKEFRWNARYISHRLSLSVAQAQLAMNLLLKLGLVRTEAGSVRRVHDEVTSSTEVPSEAVRSFHRSMLSKAIQALEIQRIDERDITGVGLAVDPKRLPQIKREISDFQDQLVERFSKGTRHEVYFLEMAFFRLTQEGSSGTKK